MFREGRRRTCGSLEAYLRTAPNALGPRIGVVVPRHGQTIVERNRLRRRLRELLRTEWLPAARERDRGADLLVRTRRSAYERTFPELQTELRSCLEALGVPALDGASESLEGAEREPC
jgi:ribonuclease P protein component